MDLDKIELIEATRRPQTLAEKGRKSDKARPEAANSKAASLFSDEADNEELGEIEELTTRFLKQRQDRLDRQVLKLAQTLIRNGYKVTDPRLEIIEAITTFDNGFNIEELAERINEQARAKGVQSPGIASIFRAVKLLTEELGLLQRVHSGDGCHRYALQRGHQHQVVCRCCERTIEFEGCDFDELTRFLQVKTGFQLEGHWIEFFGLCQVCRQAQPNETIQRLKPNALLPHEHPTPAEEKLRVEPVDVRQVSQTPVSVGSEAD